MNKYRKIYEEHYGIIPKDEDGRSYEIHHIDSNRSNNSPENLMAVSIQEHYNIHKSQGDWGACFYMLRRMALSPEEISELAKKYNRQRIIDGTHHLLSGEIQRQSNQKRIVNGTHNFLTRPDGTSVASDRVAKGTNPFQTRPDGTSMGSDQIVAGTHNFLGPKMNKRRVEAGTHNFLGPNSNQSMLDAGIHPSQQKKECIHCGKRFSAGMYARWHGDNCKQNKKVK